MVTDNSVVKAYDSWKNETQRELYIILDFFLRAFIKIVVPRLELSRTWYTEETRGQSTKLLGQLKWKNLQEEGTAKKEPQNLHINSH